MLQGAAPSFGDTFSRRPTTLLYLGLHLNVLFASSSRKLNPIAMFFLRVGTVKLCQNQSRGFDGPDAIFGPHELARARALYPCTKCAPTHKCIVSSQ